jgi:activator of HSP90 ATPase
MTHDFKLSDELPADTQTIYDAWLSGDQHTVMTGGKAEVEPRVGGPFTAWDGYITGHTITLEPGQRIVQSWRTSDFSETDQDSQIEVTLEPLGKGTKITIHHSNVPDRLRSFEAGGWQSHYFDPMRAHFAAI